MSNYESLGAVKRQDGAVLILFTFLIGLFITSYLLKTANFFVNPVQQDIETYEELALAKKALIAWSVTNQNNPGQLPFPDRSADGNYDGKSDCNSPTSTFSYSFLIGQLPIYGQTNPCISPQLGIGIDKKKHRLWYAVSRNLVHRYEINPPNKNPSDPIINPSIIRNPIYPWLKVLDKNGNLISGRVAAVIMNPENAIGSQNRAGIASIEQFLDIFQMNGKTFSNRDYDSEDEDFILGENMKNVDANNSNYTQPYLFNDKLVYITIDELISVLEQRAGLEAKSLLNDYKNKNGSYPFAAPLGSHDVNAILDNESGMLPFDLTNQCSCLKNQCSCRFDNLEDVKFTRKDGENWNKKSNNCNFRTSSCTCSGEGSCGFKESIFSCNKDGKCFFSPLLTNNSATGEFIFTLKKFEKIYSFDDKTGCSNKRLVNGKEEMFSNEVTCNGNGNGEFVISNWLWKNHWQDYIFYHYSPTSSLQAGNKTGITSLLISTGDAITTAPFSAKTEPQSRPSININDYLDSIENINEDHIYDSKSKLKANNYNDLIFIVNP